jgi:hypothetical integral membrane protein (TIGR02206 family)
MAASLEPFGPDHLAALGSTAAAAFAAAAAVRRHPPCASTVKRLVAASLVVSLVALMVLDAGSGVSWRSFAPLQLCDVLVPLAVWALMRKEPLPFELTLMWSAAGTVPALLTPDVAEGFPHFRFLLYFAQHGGLVVATATLLADGMRPRTGTPLRALGWLNVLALAVGLVDALTGANFMYLRAKPGAATPLDDLGPWPLYILVCEPIALVAFMAVGAVVSGVFRSTPRNVG